MAAEVVSKLAERIAEQASDRLTREEQMFLIRVLLTQCFSRDEVRDVQHECLKALGEA